MRHHTFRFPLVVALSLAALACSATLDGPEQPGTTVPITRLRAEPYSFTYYSGLKQSERLIIRDEATWRATWLAIWGTVTPTPALPTIDFDREMVVVAALGERRTGGFGIVVESATVAGADMMVRIRTTAPGPTCVTTLAFTQPVDVARLPRTAAPVSFADDAVVIDCH